MKKLWIIAAAVIITACGTEKTTSQTKPSQAVDMETTADGNLLGLREQSAFEKAPFSNWFTPAYEEYEPDATTTAALKKAMKDVQVKVFMGTWCSDSQRETPAFYKLMNTMDIKPSVITLVTVDRSKKEPAVYVNGNDIERVPTFIFYKDGKELGRYVEYARETMEKDFLKIVTGANYKHSYQN